MSQGIILKDGQVKRSDMDVPKCTFTCSCGAKFIIYHHAAHPENVEDHTAWLAAEMEKDHKRCARHRDSYQCPL